MMLRDDFVMCLCTVFSRSYRHIIVKKINILMNRLSFKDREMNQS